jgi:hypothetical protein
MPSHHVSLVDETYEVFYNISHDGSHQVSLVIEAYRHAYTFSHYGSCKAS